MAAEVNVLDIVPQCKATIHSRFSSLKYMKAVNQFNPIQKSFIAKHSLENLLRLPDHLMIPLHLLQWLVNHTSNGGPKYFQHKEKVINFNKSMVDKIFGFPVSSKPYVTESSDPEIIREVDQLRAYYLKGEKKISVSNLESVLLGSNNEEVFIRSFIMFFITCVLCPGTYHSVNPKYLFSLRDSVIHEVGSLDYGTLCLNHLWDEMIAWKHRLLEDPSNNNKLLWIGGCLPVLATVYMDCVNFNGNVGQINYGLPRMAFLTNADFAHLILSDRNMRSTKSYGVLQLRDMSLTPYGDYLAIMPAVAEPFLPEPFGHQADPVVQQVEPVVHQADPVVQQVESVVHQADPVVQQVEHVVHQAEPIVQQSEPVVGQAELFMIQDDIGGVIGNHHDIIDISDSEMSSDSPGSYSIEPEDMPYSPRASVDYMEARVVSTVVKQPGRHREGLNEFGDGLHNIALCYAQISDSYSANEVDEGFVNTSSARTNTYPTTGLNQENANLAIVENNGTTAVQNSLDKKNRRRRAAKTTSPEPMDDVIMDPFIEQFNNMFLKNKRYKQANSPLFIEVGRFSVTYANFYKSFKANGHVDQDCMNIFSLIYNDRSRYDSLKKFMFSAYISTKFMEDPDVFDKHSALCEFNGIHYSGAGFDLSTMDILHFPYVFCERWVLLCVNTLYHTINFFDPSSNTSKEEQEKIMSNLAINLSSVCKERNFDFGKDIEKFKKPKPPSYTAEASSHEDGIYVMLYSENWLGKFMKKFSKDIIPEYRIVKAYDILYCIQNEIPLEKFEKIKKRKRKSWRGRRG